MSKVIQVFIGIDISSGARPITFVALDAEQKIIAIGAGDAPDALAYAAGQTGNTLIAVNAAAHPNQGRMNRPEVRQALEPVPAKGKFTHLRQVEYELCQAGFAIPETPALVEKSLPWVRRGFALVEKLEYLHYQPYSDAPNPEAPSRQWIETNTDAGFWSLLGVLPLPAGTLEGRIQRQLALLDDGLDIPDAMDFFEEITRYKILKSQLPLKNIFPQAELSALAAAHTAWLLDRRPQQIWKCGEPEEGYLYLPCPPKR